VNLFEDNLAPSTRFDWNFRLGDIPVRVHPYFWLTTALLGLNNLRRPFIEILMYLLIWTIIVFVSILVHELGHILMGRAFGRRGHIVLTGLCGLAVGASDLPTRGQRIAVHLAGPGAGFMLAALTVGVFYAYNPVVTLFELGSLFGVQVRIGPDVQIPPEPVLYVLFNMLWINIFWGLVNLLPIWPLDGGQTCREICEAYRGRDGQRLAMQISLVTAAGFAVLALIEIVTKKPLVPFLSLGGTFFSVLFFGLLAFNSYQLLQFIRRGGLDWQEEEPRAPWERDADWWKHGDGDNAWRD
jgi:membrane-associated protease RseP (regulator of RpoE activity)